MALEHERIMNGKNHATFGLSAWTATSAYVAQRGGPQLPEMLVAAPLVLVGALAPDIDEPGSKISRQLGVFRHVFPPLVRWASGGHRGLTHSPWAAVAVTVALSFVEALPLLWALAFGFGWLSHLVGDVVTPHGIPAPWSLGGDRISLDLWRSGTKIESVVVDALAVGAAVFMVSTF